MKDLVVVLDRDLASDQLLVRLHGKLMEELKSQTQRNKEIEAYERRERRREARELAIRRSRKK